MNRFVFASSLLALTLLIPGSARAADSRVEGGPAAGRAPSVVAAPRLTAEQRAIVAVQEEGRRQVESLVKSMAGLPDGPVLRALEIKVEQIKRDGEVQCLRVRAQFALQRGDLAAAHEAENQIDLILHPRPVIPVANTRGVPAREGGQP